MRTLPVLIAILCASPASAQVLGVEIRGGAGLTGYSATEQLFDPFTHGRLEAVSVDLIWNPPVNPLFLIGSPGVEVGATADFGAGPSLAHANLLWQLYVPLTPVYVEGGLGAATAGALPGGPCAVMPYATAGVGVALGESFTVNVGVDHARDFGLCGGTATEITTL
ncbi:MAG: hypothetical protein ABIY37_16900, partial [Devosia sp.]